MDKYTPPFVITNQILTSISSIMEKLGSINSFQNLPKLPTLRKQNRVRSIQSSCSIEANSLSFEQVADVINGHEVVGPQKDILEIKNAIKAYEAAFDKNPFSENDMRSIHFIMTEKLVETSGKYRTDGEGVIDGNGNVIFIAPPGNMVMELMSNLFDWAKENFNAINTLILSSVFHYEFVFIHPFSDGNGRMARLWQNVILSKWKPIFEYVTVESLIKKYQNEYYEAISQSNKSGDSTAFITFMLKMIDFSIDELLKNATLKFEDSSKYASKLLKVLKKDTWYTSKQMQKLLQLSDRSNFRNNYLVPAVKNGFVALEYPDKPTNKNQRYKKL